MFLKMTTKIRVRDDGPVLVDGGDVTIEDAEGGTFTAAGRPFALCRCGASSNKPFCDGSHREVEFQAADRAEKSLPD